MDWSDLGYAIPGYNVYKVGQDVANNSDAIKNYLFGDPKVGMDPNAAKMQDAAFQRSYLTSALGGVQNRQAPQGTASLLNQNPYNQWRGQQMGLAQQLGQVASGQQAGAGELAVNRQVGQALAAQQSAAASARGANAMLGARAAARGAADVGLAGAGQAQQAALQDQANARQLQAGVLGQGAQQDIGIAGQNAQLGQQMSLSNMQAQLQQRGMNDQAAMAYMSALTGIDQAELQARLQQEQLQVAQRNPGQIGALLGGGSSLLTAAAAM